MSIMGQLLSERLSESSAPWVFVDYKWQYDFYILILGKQNLMFKICIGIIIAYIDLKLYNASIATEFINNFI